MAERKSLRVIIKPLTALGILTALFAIMLISGTAVAQTETGQISGTVTDQTNAVIAGATIRAKSLETKAERETTTSAGGNYTITNLQPGVYEVRLEAPGFSTKVVKVQVTVGSRVSLDAALEVGQAETVVEVVGNEAGIQVNTSSQELSNVVSQKQLVELPTITRDPYSLVGLSGNIAPDTSGSGRGVGFAINGQRTASTNILLDGAANNDDFVAGVGQNVPLDSVQEFSVITSNFSAEYGRAGGGIVNVATKSGSNELHGSLYEFNRVSALASNSFENNAQYGDPNSEGKRKGVFDRNQFGYSIGGPVFKDKVFFFSSGEFTRIRSASPTRFLVPTQELIAASNSATQAFFAPFPLATPINGQVFTVSQVAAAAGSSSSGAFAKLPGGMPAFGVAAVSLPSDAGGGPPENAYELVNRFDWNINSKTTFYARYALESIDNLSVVSSSPYKGFTSLSENFNNNILFSLTRVFTPRLTSQSKFVFNRLVNNQPLGQNADGPTIYLASGATSTTLLAFNAP